MYPDALADLEQRLDQNHGVADATVLAALPAQLAKAVHADREFRERVLRMAVTCVCGHAGTYPEDLEPHWERTWRAALSTVLTLSTHELPLVRRIAVFLLSDATHHADDACAALRERWPDEPETLIRVAILHTVAALARHLGPSGRGETYRWVATLTHPAGSEISMAASLALRGFGRPDRL